MSRIKLATVFSGIGAVEFALKRMSVPFEVVFACDNGEREIEYNKQEEFERVLSLSSPREKAEYVDALYNSKTRKKNYIKESYLANYDLDNGYYFQDVCLLDGRDFYGKVDLFVGGSPCQSFSSVGAQRGLEDTRGTLFYEFARLVKEIKPKVFIYENVKNLIKHDGGNTWSIIKNVFDTLGYEIAFDTLNAVDFGIPQVRNRLFVVGYRKDLHCQPHLPKGNADMLKYVMHDFLESNCSFGKFVHAKDGELVVENDGPHTVPSHYFLTPGIERYVMKDGTKTWRQPAKIDLPIARTVLKTMIYHHRAGVDNYMRENGKVRMLTEREALRLMGFTDDFKEVVSKTNIYKQAGNSIVVDVMMAVLKPIIESTVFNTRSDE